MTRNTFLSTTLWSAAALLAILHCHAVSAQPAGSEQSLQRRVDPVIVPGKDLAGLTGISIDRIRLYSFHHDRAVAIPFQIDQRNTSGDWVWDVVYRQQFHFEEEGLQQSFEQSQSRHEEKMFDDQDPDGKAVLDENDLLVLMAKDIGERILDPHIIPEATLILELEVSDKATGGYGWAYVAYFQGIPPPLSSTRYMHYDAERSLIRSPLYKFNISEDHPALITDLRINDFSIANRIKVKGNVTLSLPLPRQQIYFDEEDIHGYTEGYIAGPVRIIKRNVTYLSLSGGLIKTRDMICDHFYYAHHAEIPVCLSIRFPVKEVAMTLTADYLEPPFHNHYMGKAVDPVPNHDTHHSIPSRMHQLGNEWMALDSHEASIVSLMKMPNSLYGYAKSQPCICNGRPKSGHMMNSPGYDTEAGFLITTSADCPKGEYVLYGSYLISDQPYYPGDEEAALNLQHNKLTTHVSTLWSAKDGP